MLAEFYIHYPTLQLKSQKTLPIMLWFLDSQENRYKQYFPKIMGKLYF